MGRALVSAGLWVVAAAGALATAFFVAMLLTPGYGDAVIAVFAAVSALWTLAAVGLLRRLSRARRARRRGAVDVVLEGRLLEEVAPSRRRWTITSLASGVLFVAAVVIAVDDGPGPDLLLVLVLGPLFALSLRQLVPGAAWLRITTRGLVSRSLGRTRAHRWEDVDDFRVYDVRTRWTTLRLVGWRASEQARADWPAARWLRWPSGVDDGLPTEYQADPEELAARLQRYRDDARASARPGSGPDRTRSGAGSAS